MKSTPTMTRTLQSIAIVCVALIGISSPLQAADPQEEEKTVTSEPFGKLSLGQASEEVVKLLGKPDTKGEDVVQGADGTLVQDWNYPAEGLRIVMQSLEKGGAQTVHMIQAKAPCKLATARGIEIGSTEEAVEKAYAKEQDESPRKAGEPFLAGSLYDGVEFTFTDGKVSEIFIGVTAE